METRSLNLLDEALGLYNNHQKNQTEPFWPLKSKVVIIEDCVETNGAFILYHLMKRSLSSSNSSVILLSLTHPFSHYDRILRKLGCNLVAQRENGGFCFFDLLRFRCGDENEKKDNDHSFVALYGKLHETICSLLENNRNHVMVMIDDLSLMEVAAHGSSDLVLDFLHYCNTLTLEFDCSLVILNHGDIYVENPRFLLQLEHLADVVIRSEPLVTGLAADVHGQLTVLNRGLGSVEANSKISKFHFQVKDNSVEYFYPGMRTSGTG